MLAALLMRTTEWRRRYRRPRDRSDRRPVGDCDSRPFRRIVHLKLVRHRQWMTKTIAGRRLVTLALIVAGLSGGVERAHAAIDARRLENPNAPTVPVPRE